MSGIVGSSLRKIELPGFARIRRLFNSVKPLFDLHCDHVKQVEFWVLKGSERLAVPLVDGVLVFRGKIQRK